MGSYDDLKCPENIHDAQCDVRMGVDTGLVYLSFAEVLREVSNVFLRQKCVVKVQNSTNPYFRAAIQLMNLADSWETNNNIPMAP